MAEKRPEHRCPPAERQARVAQVHMGLCTLLSLRAIARGYLPILR